MINIQIPKRFLFIFSTIAFALLGSFNVLLIPDGGSVLQVVVFSLISFLLLMSGLLIVPSKKIVFIKVFAVPLVFCFSTFMLLHYFPNLNTMFKLSYIAFSTIVFYYLLLSLNIFLVVHEKGSVIPLVRPAKTAFILLEVLTLFLFFTAVFKILLPEPVTEATFLFQTIVLSTAAFVFAEQYWWSQNLEDEITSFVGQESLVIAFLVFMFSVSLSFLESEAFFRSLTITAVFYISISFFRAVVTHRFTHSMLIEFLIVAIVTGFVFLLG